MMKNKRLVFILVLLLMLTACASALAVSIEPAKYNEDYTLITPSGLKFSRTFSMEKPFFPLMITSLTGPLPLPTALKTWRR